MDYFEEQVSLLNIEHQYDKEQYETLLLRSSVAERKLKGVTWFPIMIKHSELGRGDYLTVSIAKTSNLEDEHRFRYGMPVSLFSNHDATVDRIDGIIAHVNRDTMKISFRVEELPDWTRKGKLGVDLLFDENSYREMFDALKKAKELRSDPTQGALIRYLIAEEEPLKHLTTIKYDNKKLNESQNNAIQKILNQEAISIVHGPPGTGKTTTLTHAVAALLKHEKKQILLVAASNTAVDVLTERLDQAGIQVTRIGNPVKVSPHLQELTLDAQMDKHPANKEVKQLKKQARAYNEMAQKYKRSFGKAEREQRKALFDEARRIMREVEHLQDFISEDVLNKAQVITATLVGSNQYILRNRRYETLIIDEAAQALEPACWIPILKANRVVFAGDHLQLPPTIKSNMRADAGLYHTLFEKLVSAYPDSVSLLQVQYRMNRQIMQYPSQALYQNQLLAGESVADWTLKDDLQPLIFIDTAGAGFEETQVDTATFNEEEAYFMLRHLKNMVEKLAESYDILAFPSIAIITPYRKQATFLKDLVSKDEVLQALSPAIQVNTIDSFQGQEKDIIYIGLTRSNTAQQIGFLADVRRMNVAMTRAKKKLVVVGDSATVGQHTFYKDFISYAESISSYHSVWEWTA